MSTPHRPATIAGTSADQSRPTHAQTKNFGFFMKNLGKLRGHKTNANGVMNTTSVTTVHRKTHGSRTIRRRQVPQPTLASSMDNKSVLSWLERDCPGDLLPRILAFAGPQTTAALSRTCRFWKEVIDLESTWRTLCEELYKWKQGDDVPVSWRSFYKYSPCVPVDFPTVAAAFSLVGGPGAEQTHGIRVLLRPGRYVLQEAITVQAPASVRVEVATMQMPLSFVPIDQTASYLVESEMIRKHKSSGRRSLLSCQTMSAVDQEDEYAGLVETFEPSMLDSHRGALMAPGHQRATLVLRTRRHNEPIIRVRQGSATLRNLELRHVSHGLDIWNGNAAVQIQPPNGPNDRPITVIPAPTLTMDHVEVTSASGRGIVNIDGGQLNIRNCYIHDCAATGIYVGGPGSRAEIEQTDVVRNGHGNTTHRRGIARGHSGVYLEQGHASILDCNISQNSLTGISAVSPENAILDLQESELVSNGTFQLEMPGIGSLAYSRSKTSNNILSANGRPHPRSGLVVDGAF